MQSHEAQLLSKPPASLVRLARNSGNMGDIELHTLLAFLLGRISPSDENMKLRHLMVRSSRGQIQRAAEDLGIPFCQVAERSLALLGVEAGYTR
jgi:hypothetical protein